MFKAIKAAIFYYKHRQHIFEILTLLPETIALLDRHTLVDITAANYSATFGSYTVAQSEYICFRFLNGVLEHGLYLLRDMYLQGVLPNFIVVKIDKEIRDTGRLTTPTIYKIQACGLADLARIVLTHKAESSELREIEKIDKYFFNEIQKGDKESHTIKLLQSILGDNYEIL